jgi:hypothetical protein
MFIDDIITILSQQKIEFKAQIDPTFILNNGAQKKNLALGGPFPCPPKPPYPTADASRRHKKPITNFQPGTDP